MPNPRRGLVDGWLEEFVSKSTRTNYLCGLKHFVQALGGDPQDCDRFLEDYLGAQPTLERFIEDFKAFLTALEKRPPKTLVTYAHCAKGFFADHGYRIPDDEWNKIKRRRQLRSIALTRDKAPTKEQLRQILSYLDEKGRALVLFLASTGCRIGETCALGVDDLMLDHDPPQAEIRPLTTKEGVGGRTVAMSYEARDAIIQWFDVKAGKTKPGGGEYSAEKVFGITPATARGIFDRAVANADLEKRDPSTKRRVIHIHSLRKFFRSNIGLDRDLIDALMGHREYLDAAYKRLTHEDIMAEYKRAMHRVSVLSDYPTGHVDQETIDKAFKDASAGSEVSAALKVLQSLDEDQQAQLFASLGITSRAMRIKKTDQVHPETAIPHKPGDRKDRPIHRIVPNDEIDNYEAQGWTILVRPDSKTAIMQKTH